MKKQEVKEEISRKLPKLEWTPRMSRVCPEKSISVMRKDLRRIQEYISSFTYNLSDKLNNSVRKDLGMKRITRTAREIMKNGLPIRCVEATFLATYMTTGILELSRIPIHFKSKLGENIHRHIVLFVSFMGKFGALGLSRKEELMYKELRYGSMSDLIYEFKASYENNGHDLLLVGFGEELPHSFYSLHEINWRVFSIIFENQNESESKIDIDVFWKDLKSGSFFVKNQRPKHKFKIRLLPIKTTPPQPRKIEV